jgi:hypothetical protein
MTPKPTSVCRCGLIQYGKLGLCPQCESPASSYRAPVAPVGWTKLHTAIALILLALALSGLHAGHRREAQEVTAQ